jgi:hypothetical protein
MDRQDCELIADVLKRRIVDIKKMREAADVECQEDEHAMLVQILVLAHDLGIAFAKQDPTFDDILVNAVRSEMATWVRKPATNAPWGRVPNNPERAEILGDKFTLWAKVWDDKPIFRVLPFGTKPHRDDPGVYDLDSAFAKVGLTPPKEPWPQNPQ